MQRGNLDDLPAFLAVARERSFTKAAAKLGISQSALSHTIRELEARLGVRLLTRTTRSVSLTQAGERLFDSVGLHVEEIEAAIAAVSELSEKPAGTIRLTVSDHAFTSVLWPKLAKLLRDYPDIKVEIVIDNGLTNIVAERFDEIEAELDALSDLRDKPAGTIRITVSDHAYKSVLWPKLAKLLRDHPDIKAEIVMDNGLTDIVAERFDAGVRLGEQVEKDMIAVRIGPDVCFAVVGAKSYFAKRPPPMTPQELTDHICINMRFSTHGALWAWDFERNGRELKVRVEGQIVLNDTFEILDAALDGFGIAYVPEDLAEPHLKSGRLKRVLDEWCPPWPGYHLYYPIRRQTSPAFTLVVDALRYRGPATP